MLVIIHAGQTGVERGAHDAARACGLGIAGFMPQDARDELGPLPEHVRARLTPHPERGVRPAVRGNIAIASAALVIVPDAGRAESMPGMTWILQSVRGRRLPLLQCDVHADLVDVAAWARQLPMTCGSCRLLVTGPRETRWVSGSPVARRVITAVAEAIGVGSQRAWSDAR